jgi:hypothetical protein
MELIPLNEMLIVFFIAEPMPLFAVHSYLPEERASIEWIKSDSP